MRQRHNALSFRKEAKVGRREATKAGAVLAARHRFRR
jgi:hypothetical protein